MNDQQISDILKQSKTIAVVGLSVDPAKASHEVASYLQSQGYEIVPVNPNAGNILGRAAHPDLRNLDGPVDIVDIFRRSEHVLEVVQQAVSIRPKLIWLQSGIVNDEAKRLAEQAGIPFVMDRCLKVEHRRLLGAVKI
ncbi:CoA-binding protein [Fodinisporobacter ferrooxydans]|uniref:CoA-binding protein n=1 Tax=Fodinisporobacter ferrooxydans TaxID=2901836 RepID=A0ABY4CK77_9BACL|nr:CoA-binding protein [Alicyclobacillaceae bacterium MYW30-H2]